MHTDLFTPGRLGDLVLPNRVVMAPMSRVRGTADGLATDSMAHYFAQRASAGLLVTDGVQPSRQGQANPNSAGLIDDRQAASWRPVTHAVHANSGRVFAQLMHGGRIGHEATTGIPPVGPSAIAARDTTVFTSAGPLPAPVPRALTTGEVPVEAAVFGAAATRADAAGFDGVELHGANGYLIGQFLATSANQRTDRYGGSIPNRIRFAVEAVEAAADAIGARRVGIRLSPGAGIWDAVEDDVPELYTALLRELSRLDLAYVHLVASADDDTMAALRRIWPGTLIVNPGRGDVGGGTDRAAADLWLDRGADFIAFGRAFIANPDLVERLRAGLPLAVPDEATFYTGGDTGYLTYPIASRAS